MYLHFPFCLPKSFFFWSAGSFFAPEPPFLPPRGGATRVGLQSARNMRSKPRAVRGIAQPLVLRDFLWGISIVSLDPHSLGHPSLRIPSAGRRIVLYCILSCYSSGKSLFALGHQVKRWPSHEKPICSSIRSSCSFACPFTYHPVNQAAPENIFIKGESPSMKISL